MSSAGVGKLDLLNFLKLLTIIYQDTLENLMIPSAKKLNGIAHFCIMRGISQQILLFGDDILVYLSDREHSFEQVNY